MIKAVAVKDYGNLYSVTLSSNKGHGDGFFTLETVRASDARAKYLALSKAEAWAMFFQCPVTFNDCDYVSLYPLWHYPPEIRGECAGINGWLVDVQSSVTDRNVGQKNDSGELDPIWWSVYIIKETTMGVEKTLYKTYHSAPHEPVSSERDSEKMDRLKATAVRDADGIALGLGCKYRVLNGEPVESRILDYFKDLK